jgi:hypothetical protein
VLSGFEGAGVLPAHPALDTSVNSLEPKQVFLISLTTSGLPGKFRHMPGKQPIKKLNASRRIGRRAIEIPYLSFDEP